MRKWTHNRPEASIAANVDELFLMLKEMMGIGVSVTVLKDEIVAPCQPRTLPSG